MQTQAAEATPKEVVFDEQGNTIEEVVAEPDPVADEAKAAAAGEAPAKKFRIGDQEFSTEGEALAFAQQQVEIDNAYQQGVREASANLQVGQPGVTPSPAAPAVVENVDELYTNPQEFLRKRDAEAEQRILNKLDARDMQRSQDDAVWREFTDRHPTLAEFRGEVEQFVQLNNKDVRAIVQTKGRPASYDFIATKLKSRFEAYSAALKPKRELPNTGGGVSPTQKASGVTPKPTENKPLSLSEQVNKIRKRR